MGGFTDIVLGKSGRGWWLGWRNGHWGGLSLLGSLACEVLRRLKGKGLPVSLLLIVEGPGIRERLGGKTWSRSRGDQVLLEDGTLSLLLTHAVPGTHTDNILSVMCYTHSHCPP